MRAEELHETLTNAQSIDMAWSAYDKYVLPFR